MPEATEEWHAARLIPTAGIRGQEEQERRATSSLLAVMGAVPDFGRALLAELKAPRGVAVDGRKLRTVGLFHLSWWRVITEAIVQHRFRGIEDEDQAWILGELIAYLDHEKSGASGFQDMGDKWVSVRKAAAAGTLRPTNPEAREVAERWDQFVDYLSLGLSQDLGRDVKPVRPRKQTSDARLDATSKALAEEGTLRAVIKVPDAVGPLTVQADLRTRKVSTSVPISAPGDGRPLTRIKWILRQMPDAPADLRLDVSFTGSRETTSLLLNEAREYPQRLLASDPKRDPRSFDLTVRSRRYKWCNWRVEVRKVVPATAGPRLVG